MKTPEEMALEYIKNVETARNLSVTATAFPQMQRCFLAGYQAAKDQLLTQFQSLLSSYAETSFHPNHTAWQIFDKLKELQAAKDQLADADKVMCNTTMEEIKAVNTGELMPITNLPTPAKWISVKERLPEIVPTQGMNYWLTSTCVLIATKEKTTHVAHLTHWTREPEADWAACACDTPGHDVEPERWKLSEVTHWMPLPEAPKEDKE